MRDRGRWLGGLVSLLWALVGAAPAAAQVRSPLDVWNRFYAGCAQQPGQEHLCACAGTELIRRCQALGVTEAPALAQCLVTNEPAWNADVTRLCEHYGHLQLGPNVPRPRPRPVSGTGPAVSRDTLWSATFVSCRDASPADGMRELGCACVATYSVEACAPQPQTPASYVEACGGTLGPEVERIFPQCRSFQALTTPTSATARAAPPPAPPLPTTEQSGSAVCDRLAASLPDPEQRTACADVIGATGGSPDEFVSLVPRGGSVVLFGRPTRDMNAVRARIRREGGMTEMIGREVDAAVVGDAGSPILVVWSGWRESNIVDRPNPQATFRWDAANRRWDLVTLGNPPEE